MRFASTKGFNAPEFALGFIPYIGGVISGGGALDRTAIHAQYKLFLVDCRGKVAWRTITTAQKIHRLLGPSFRRADRDQLQSGRGSRRRIRRPPRPSTLNHRGARLKGKRLSRPPDRRFIRQVRKLALRDTVMESLSGTPRKRVRGDSQNVATGKGRPMGCFRLLGGLGGSAAAVGGARTGRARRRHRASRAACHGAVHQRPAANPRERLRVPRGMENSRDRDRRTRRAQRRVFRRRRARRHFCWRAADFDAALAEVAAFIPAVFSAAFARADPHRRAVFRAMADHAGLAQLAILALAFGTAAITSTAWVLTYPNILPSSSLNDLHWHASGWLFAFEQLTFGALIIAYALLDRNPRSVSACSHDLRLVGSLVVGFVLLAVVALIATGDRLPATAIGRALTPVWTRRSSRFWSASTSSCWRSSASESGILDRGPRVGVHRVRVRTAGNL